MLNLSHAILHLSHAISHAILHLSHAISHLSQTLKNLKRYDCLNVWKQLKNFPGGTENKSDVFCHVICKRIFCQHSFFCFRTKKKWEGGLRRQSDVFLHDIRKRIFCENYFSCFCTKKKWEGGLKWQSDVFLPGGRGQSLLNEISVGAIWLRLWLYGVWRCIEN